MMISMLITVYSFAQYQPVQVMFSVMQPVTPQIYNDYDKLSATLVSTEPVECYLTASLEGDMGIMIRTEPGIKPSAPLVLMPNLPLVINSGNWQDVLNLDHLLITGTTKEEIIAHGLAEGQYSMCVMALDYMTGQLLSGDPPAGCVDFMVIALTPPVFTPISELLYFPSFEFANLVSWIADPLTPPGTHYLLAGKRVPTGMNGYEAWENPSIPYTFERAVNSTYYNLSGTDLGDITPDLGYIMGIQAIGPTGISWFQNNGWSEPFLFYIGRDIVLAHNAAVSKGEPAPHISDNSSNQHDAPVSKEKHNVDASKKWPPDHKYKKTKTWGDQHKEEISKTWPSNHDGGYSRTWGKNGPHLDQKSSTWPPDHTEKYSSQWPAAHMGWPGNHDSKISGDWRKHDPKVSLTWPPNHDQSNSNNWKPKNEHNVEKSPTWPPRHLVQSSKKWPGRHCAEVSREWPANHNYDKSKAGNFE